MQKKCQFNKTALSIDQLFDLLKSRGLIVDDPARTKRYLSFIGYYRLSGYFRYYQTIVNGENRFKDGVTFNDILDLYIFDRKLRMIVMDVIERVEVSIRSTISNNLSEKYGPHWYLDPGYFNSSYNHNYLIDQIKRETGYSRAKKRNESCAHYYNKYDTPALPPSWMVAEVLPLGSWSMIYENLMDTQEQKTISQTFGLQPVIMISWLRSLSYLRNLCAHHSRIWNRVFTIKPKIAKKYSIQLNQNDLFYSQAVILNVFLSAVINKSRWQYRLLNLLKEYPNILTIEMGFPKEWQKDPFWGIS